jgi:uncharacterized membrane protein
MALNFSVFVEMCLILLLSYARPLEIALGTRAVASPHFMVPTFAYYFFYVLWDEVRKVYVRSGTHKTESGEIKYTNWIARNTFW